MWAQSQTRFQRAPLWVFACLLLCVPQWDCINLPSCFNALANLFYRHVCLREQRRISQWSLSASPQVFCRPSPFYLSAVWLKKQEGNKKGGLLRRFHKTPCFQPMNILTAGTDSCHSEYCVTVNTVMWYWRCLLNFCGQHFRLIIFTEYFSDTTGYRWELFLFPFSSRAPVDWIVKLPWRPKQLYKGKELVDCSTTRTKSSLLFLNSKFYWSDSPIQYPEIHFPREPEQYDTLIIGAHLLF